MLTSLAAPPRLDPAGEPAGHPHQVGVIQLLVRAGVQPAPPGVKPTGIMPQRKVGIEHDPIDTVIAARQQIAVPLTAGWRGLLSAAGSGV